ncbi:MAG: PaaI family thioesterase [Acidimicrobiales bacterium]
MNLDETDDELAARADMASALQRLGHALVGHRIDIATATSITEAADAFHEHVTALPTRDRVAEMAANPRFVAAITGQQTSTLGADGEAMDLFRDSIVSGRTNPMGVGLEVRRDGDTAVATTTLGPAFEGAPGRAHGGIIAAILDETMGFVLPLIGDIAYTANLTIDYVAPAPLHTTLTFTAALRDRADRKLWIEARGASQEGVFVRAEALFLTVDLSTFSNGH